MMTESEPEHSICLSIAIPFGPWLRRILCIDWTAGYSPDLETASGGDEITSEPTSRWYDPGGRSRKSRLIARYSAQGELNVGASNRCKE